MGCGALVGRGLATALLAAVGCVHRERPVVIVDNDAGVDDIAALAFLARAHERGEVEIRAVTVVNDGVGYPGSGLRHVRCLLEAAGLESIPTADGGAGAANEIPAAIRESAEQVLGDSFEGCTASRRPARRSAAELIVETVRRSRGRVTIVASGPLGNVAAALAAAPEIAARVRVHAMGGAICASGNLCCGAPHGFDGTQEYNLWVDPAGFQGALSALGDDGVEMVTLDAAGLAPVTLDFVRRLAASRTPVGRVVAAISLHPGVYWGVRSGGYFWGDALSAVAFTHPEVVGYEQSRISVVQSGASAGRTAVSEGGTRVRAAVGVDREAFERVFLEAMRGEGRGR